MTTPEPDPYVPPAAPVYQATAPVYGAPAAHDPAAGYHAAPVVFDPAGVFGAPPAVKRRRPIGSIVTIVLLSLALITAIVFLVLYVQQLNDANARIEKQKDQIEEQEDLIDKKETFGAAMEELLDMTKQLDSSLFGTLVPTASYQLTASRAWSHRWDSDDLDDDIADANEHTERLEALIAAASLEASSNTTGSYYETVIDELGGGYVTSLLYEADSFCESDALACVQFDEPYTVHFDSVDNSVEYMTDFLRTGIAYHEFAHVLQATNPDPTETALDAFGGDKETMADCFALTYLDGWTLEHRIWVGKYTYWDVNIGYGYTCDDAQRQVVRDWYADLGYTPQAITQER